MSVRDLNSAIQYLKREFPKYANVIESACKENLLRFPSPIRSELKVNAVPHRYGPNESIICQGRARELVFREMLADGACTAPTTSRNPIHTGKIETLLPVSDMIVKLVADHEWAVYNVTLPKHVFFPGYVRLGVEERGETTVVAVSGSGIGNWEGPNMALGPTLFRQILNRYLVPRVQRAVASR